MIADLRVFIEDPDKKVIRRISHFMKVDVTSTLDNIGTASITLSNKDDYWFECVKRKKKIKNGDYYYNWYKELGQSVDRWREWQVQQEEEGKESVFNPNVGYELTGIGLLSRVWIDCRVRDDVKNYVGGGDWVGIFTGVVTEIHEGYDVDGEPEVVLSCKDLLRYFEVSPVLSQKAYKDLDFLIAAIKPPAEEAQNPPVDLSQSLALDEATKAALERIKERELMKLFVEDTMYNMDPKEYLSHLVTLVNFTNTYEGFTSLFDKTPSLREDKEKVKEQFKKDLGQDPFIEESWFRKELLWDIGSESGEKIIEGSGSSNVRDLDEDEVNKKHEYSESDSVYKTLMAPRKVYVDALIFKNLEVIKLALKGKLALFGSQRVDAWKRMKILLSTLYFNFYQSGCGDLVLQFPRWDNLPTFKGSGNNFLDYGWARSIIEKRKSDEFSSKEKEKEKWKGRQAYHSGNYVIQDTGLRSWSFEENESALRTNAICNFSNIDFDINLSPDAQLVYGVGRAVSKEYSPLKYGFRIFETSEIAVIKFPEVYKDDKRKNAFTDTVLQIVNAENSSGNISLNMRVDLQVGRTVYLVDRDILGYLEQIRHSIEVGKDIKTTCKLGQIHSPVNRIGYPYEATLQLFKGYNDDIEEPAHLKEEVLPKKVGKDIFREVAYGKFGNPASPIGKYLEVTQKFSISHSGLDFRIPSKSEGFVRAVWDGEVNRVNWNVSLNGNCIGILHTNKAENIVQWETIYLHLANSPYTFDDRTGKRKELKVGDKVKKGDKIGVAGDTGKSRGIHLHFALLNKTTNEYHDPWNWFLSGSLKYVGK